MNLIKRAARVLNLAVLGAGLGIGSAALAETATPPAPLGNPGEWVTTSDYPAAALHEERSGLVAFRLKISTTGAVSGCEVLSSSGSADLDAQTCALISARAKFRPATGADGKPIEGAYMNRVRWVLPSRMVHPFRMLIRCGANSDLQFVCLS